MSKMELFQGDYDSDEMSNAAIINKRRVVNGFYDGLIIR